MTGAAEDFDAEQFLNSLEPIGWKLGLERMEKLSDELGRPQDSLRHDPCGRDQRQVLGFPDDRGDLRSPRLPVRLFALAASGPLVGAGGHLRPRGTGAVR